ncbi:hypothetical protein WOLCODRAFT_91049 [Wolfiporia cocos MD-104 SS10]|uniref:Uncharacterized protein n=1 Tax=Wolfiporia cocos (strain MD-104) TaxID=742152 RepID=A0A2H3K138_WOLCO|nr:hypothetical protein WOLCODRAFT_91049 [Wolfiporia cocos MD-104 SS10]
MSPRQPITLYDVPCKLDPPAWSPNVWRTRFILNFKELPYVTQWVHYTDIQRVLPSAGVPPTRTSKPLYSVPAIIDIVEGEAPVMLADSPLIADYLEQTYPERSIYPGGRDAHLQCVEKVIQHVNNKIAFMVIPHVERILEGGDREYYLSTREMKFGVPLGKMFPVEKQEAMWADLMTSLTELSAYIDGIRKGEKWLFGTTDDPSYADFVLGGALIWFKLGGPEGGWDKLRAWHEGRWERHLENLESYMQIS